MTTGENPILGRLPVSKTIYNTESTHNPRVKPKDDTEWLVRPMKHFDYGVRFSNRTAVNKSKYNTECFGSILEH
jgi:hypothetical protein